MYLHTYIRTLHNANRSNTALRAVQYISNYNTVSGMFASVHVRSRLEHTSHVQNPRTHTKELIKVRTHRARRRVRMRTNRHRVYRRMRSTNLRRGRFARMRTRLRAWCVLTFKVCYAARTRTTDKPHSNLRNPILTLTCLHIFQLVGIFKSFRRGVLKDKHDLL
jgi:hypothetical protein